MHSSCFSRVEGESSGKEEGEVEEEEEEEETHESEIDIFSHAILTDLQHKTRIDNDAHFVVSLSFLVCSTVIGILVPSC
jgi:hypothetical protein